MMRQRVTYRLDEGPSHTTLLIWVNGAQSGELVVRGDEVEVLRGIVKCLAEVFGASHLDTP